MDEVDVLLGEGGRGLETGDLLDAEHLEEAVDEGLEVELGEGANNILVGQSGVDVLEHGVFLGGRDLFHEEDEEGAGDFVGGVFGVQKVVLEFENFGGV